MKRWTRRNRARYSQYELGKIQCPICNGWYHQLASHTTQRHDIDAIALKKLLNKPSFRGITSPQSHAKSREAVYNNPHCIEENLIQRGKPTRVRPGNNFRNGRR